ncbi:hypothetical protein 1 [Changjiang crawfish virus 7]|uniref:hypothetical protein 1 n=1 Tax=Changjiang crawfish virus 7 TaxID=1922771 RepID=UPI00090B4C43|nr:hypothetical protein 1 [Changjiang crawfish virus 7]APG76237.1 hypothetical protein 1 [Changjiang crawfish virus 7]
MVLLELSAALLAAKWLAGGGAAGYGGYKVTQYAMSIPEVALDEHTHGHGAWFEHHDERLDVRFAADAGMPPGHTHETVMDGEGALADAMHRQGAAAGLGAGEHQVGTAFIRYWVSQLRVEFPARLDRPSDRAAMSKWLAGKLRARGVRITHMANAIPKCVALALNRSRAEVEAEEIAEAAAIRTRGERWAYNLRRYLRVRGARQPTGSI